MNCIGGQIRVTFNNFWPQRFSAIHLKTLQTSFQLAIFLTRPFQFFHFLDQLLIKGWYETYQTMGAKTMFCILSPSLFIEPVKRYVYLAEELHLPQCINFFFIITSIIYPIIILQSCPSLIPPSPRSSTPFPPSPFPIFYLLCVTNYLHFLCSYHLSNNVLCYGERAFPVGII